jgi:hypothetical protein
VRFSRKRSLASCSWSESELSTEQIFEENMLEIPSSVVRPSIMLQPEDLLLLRYCHIRCQKYVLRAVHQASASFSLLICSARRFKHWTSLKWTTTILQNLVPKDGPLLKRFSFIILSRNLASSARKNFGENRSVLLDQLLEVVSYNNGQLLLSIENQHRS